MKPLKITFLSLLSASLLLPASPTCAEKIHNLKDMLVTASRTPLSVQQSGASYTIIDAEQIRQRQAVHVSDLLREVPGIAVSRSGGIGAQTQIRLRGAEADQTLVLIDGIEANDPAQGSGFDFAHLLTSDIDRIEIIRGPQSALWGSDAMGGVINIITREADSGSQLTGLLEGGSFGTAHGAVGVSERGERHHVSINGNFVRSNGTNVAEQGDEDDGYRNATLNLKAGLNPLDNLELSLVARHTVAEKQFDPAPFPAFVPADGDRESDTAQTSGLAQAKLDLFSGVWQHIVSAAFTGTDNTNFADGIEDTSTQGKKLKFSYQSNVFFETPVLADASHTLTFAFENENEDFKQRGQPGFFGDPNQDQEFTTNSFIGEYRLGLWERLFISVSVRHDANDLFDDATTYRGSLSYKLSQTGTILRGAYGTAVKNPSFTDRFGFTPDTFFGNPNIKPEESRGWEIGLDQRLLGDRILISLTLFRERLEDEINGFFFDPSLGVFGGFTAVNINGNSEREGVEFALQADVTDNLFINGSYTYVDSTQDDGTGRQIREIRRPEHVASLNANYRFLADKGNINLGIDYTGEQNDSDFSTFPATPVTLDDYVLVNLTTEYALSRGFTLFGRFENLLDEDYRDVFGFDTPGIAGYAGVRVNLDL